MQLHFSLEYSRLFPFGAVAGDRFGPRGDDSASSPLTLAVPFTFVGIEHRQIIVSINMYYDKMTKLSTSYQHCFIFN